MTRRNTRERILNTALKLFNATGMSHVSTNLIALETEISPGNLYYHFRSKDDIITALFSHYEQEMLDTLAVPGERLPDLEDIWFFLHTLFETIGRHRFIYRDFNDISQIQTGLHQRFQSILQLKSHTAATFIAGLVEAKVMRASAMEREALARNIVLITTCWLPFVAMLPASEADGLDLAAWQVISLVCPYLREPERGQLTQMSLMYLRH